MKNPFREPEPNLQTLLVVGASGLVGSKVASLASSYGFELYNTTTTGRSPFPRSFTLDVTNSAATSKIVEQVRPHVIVNTAAMTNVDYCESHPREAYEVNTLGVENLADSAKSVGARLVQVSTDSVFDGETGHYIETDTPHPLNQYSLTKFEAERIVLNLPNYAIARPSVVYGNHNTMIPTSSTHGKAANFAMFVLGKLQANQLVEAVTDLFSTPTLADNLATSLLKLAKLDQNGIFHTAGRTCLSRYEFSIMIAEEFGYSTSLVRPVSTIDLPMAARRPKNSCLKVHKAENSLHMRFLTALEGIKEMKNQICASDLRRPEGVN